VSHTILHLSGPQALEIYRVAQRFARQLVRTFGGLLQRRMAIVTGE